MSPAPAEKSLVPPAPGVLVPSGEAEPEPYRAVEPAALIGSAPFREMSDADMPGWESELIDGGSRREECKLRNELCQSCSLSQLTVVGHQCQLTFGAPVSDPKSQQMPGAMPGVKAGPANGLTRRHPQSLIYCRAERRPGRRTQPE